MDMHRTWWMDGARTGAVCTDGDTDADCPQPIPFPSRRARMTLRPPHGIDVTRENRLSAMNANAAIEAVSLVNRRMNDLARELDCLWYYDDIDEAGHNDDPPTAA